jgi:hypothetical protein
MTTRFTVDEEAVAFFRKLAAEHPARHQPDLAYVLSNLGDTFHNVRRYDDALTAYKESHALFEALAATSRGMTAMSPCSNKRYANSSANLVVKRNQSSSRYDHFDARSAACLRSICASCRAASSICAPTRLLIMIEPG